MAFVVCSVDGWANIETARSIAIELAQKHPKIKRIVAYPAVQRNSTSADFSLMVLCNDAATATGVKYDLFEASPKTFDAKQIEIPYPYQNVILEKRTALGVAAPRKNSNRPAWRAQ